MKKFLVKGLMLVSMLIIAVPFGFAGAEISKSAIPVPPAVASLPTITPEPWVKVSDNPGVFLEGPAFDKKGNLYVSSIFEGRIIKITPSKKLSTVYTDPKLQPDGIAIHKDGRLFVACLSTKIVAMNPDGTNVTEIKARFEGKPVVPNDLVFDNKGNLYVTDFIGTIAAPAGGVYRFSADFNTVKPVVQNLAGANGIGIAPPQVANVPGDIVLWASETGRGSLLRIETQPDGITLSHIAGLTYPYHFTGFPGPDSMAIDGAGNVYQALVFQGRVLILNRQGIPLANVLVPGREQAKQIVTANLAFKPGTDEVYMTTGGMGGAWIYKFKGLAPGMPMFSHQK